MIIMFQVQVILLLISLMDISLAFHRNNGKVYRSRLFEHRRKSFQTGEIYALLVAGSNGWYNYRHQADVGHSFHTLRNHGIPEKNIIVMMYNDVVYNIKNPFPGKLFNRPNGEDVYHGLKIDYSGKDVNAENFLNILRGNASGVTGGNGKIIDSSSHDRIFIYFTDHGGTGLISFPDDILTVKMLNDTLSWMYANERYKQLVFYLEACESGSMFDVIRDNISVYAISAANGHESSWGTYCDNDMQLPCLGDLFSVNWMDDSDEEDLSVETLSDQYELVKKKTDKSHVMHFGDLNIAKEPVGWFQGEKKQKSRTLGISATNNVKEDSWPARDIELMYLHRQRDLANDIYEIKSFNRRIKTIHEDRRKVKTIFYKVVDTLINDPIDRQRILEERNSVENLECHDEVTKAFHLLCINFNEHDYALKYVYVLNNLCIELGNIKDISMTFIDVCNFGRL